MSSQISPPPTPSALQKARTHSSFNTWRRPQLRPVLSTPKTFTLHVIDVTHDCRLFITCTVPPSWPSCPLLPSVRQYPPHPPAWHAKSCLIPRSCEGSLPQTAARGFLWLLHPAPRVVAVHQRGRPALCLEVVVNGALAVQPVTVVVDDEESRGHEPVTVDHIQYSSHRDTHRAHQPAQAINTAVRSCVWPLAMLNRVKRARVKHSMSG